MAEQIVTYGTAIRTCDCVRQLDLCAEDCQRLAEYREETRAQLATTMQRAWLTEDEAPSDAVLALLGYVTPAERARDHARLAESEKYSVLKFTAHGRYAAEWTLPKGE